MKKNVLYSIVFLLGFPVLSIAQSERTKKSEIFFRNGEKEFNDQRYMYAVPFYITSLKYSGKNDSLASLHIAESYWHVKNYDSALAYYQLHERKYGTTFSTRQHIAELSANLKQYPEASSIYKKLATDSSKKTDKLLAERLKGFTDTQTFLRDSLDYSIHLLNLNTAQQDFSPQFFQRGMVFVSNRYSKKSTEKEFGWDGLPFANIYWIKDTAELYTIDTVAGYSARFNTASSFKVNDDYTSQTSNDNDIIVVTGTHSNYNGSLHKLAKFSDELNTKYNYGPLCFNKAGNKVYFTRNNLRPEKGHYNLEICVATFEKGNWGNIKVMPFVQPGYNFYHPALSDDERRLYFCSTKPGGMGGSDIYYVNTRTEYDLAVVFDLDNKVNTAGNELFPTIKGDTLFFSSDGYAGLGGLDIYKSYMVHGSWKTPVNIGYPVNSSFDDFGVIYNAGNTKGFFTSNRLGTDDIYAFENAAFLIKMEGTVLNRLTMNRLDIARILLRADDDEQTIIDSFVTDITGNFHFPVRPGRSYTLLTSRHGYIEDSMKVVTAGTESRLALQPILLAPVALPIIPTTPVEGDRDGDGVPDAKDKCPDTKGLKDKNGCPDLQAEIDALAKMVFFKTASAELLPASVKPLNEVCAYLAKYPNLTLYIEGHTDSRAPAPYNLDLSKRRAKSVKEYFIKKGFGAGRFVSEGFGLTRPIADNTSEEGRAMNRRVAIKADFK
jgi:outer membrane protein OmpA-like peptidoglycan-associated protein